MAAKRPLSQKEKAAAKTENAGLVTLYNKSSKQPVPIQLKAPAGTDFYLGEQTVWLQRGKSAVFPVSRLIKEQIVNQQKMGFLLIVSGNLDR